MYTATERLSLDKDGNVVKAGDPKAVRLLVHKGGKLSDEVAAKHGLAKASDAAPTPPAATVADAEAKAPRSKAGLTVDRSAVGGGTSGGVGLALNEEKPGDAKATKAPPEDVKSVLPKK